jgi:hypothetical protein
VGFVGYETEQGEVFGREVLLSLCGECWLRSEPEELDRLLEREQNRREPDE